MYKGGEEGREGGGREEGGEEGGGREGEGGSHLTPAELMV